MNYQGGPKNCALMLYYSILKVVSSTKYYYILKSAIYCSRFFAVFKHILTFFNNTKSNQSNSLKA